MLPVNALLSDPVCCLALQQTLDTTIPSPFSRMIVLGWYDGPTDGLVICGICNRSYKFSVLARDDGDYEHSSWDEGRELTIFGLTELTKEQFDTMMAALTEERPPSWPIWTVGFYNDPETFELESLSDGLALEVFWQAGDPSLAIAIHMGDVLTEILRSRQVGLDTLLDVNGDSWFELFGYSKQPGEGIDT